MSIQNNKMKKLFSLLIVFFTLASSLSAQTVYITKTGAKYHKNDCGYLRSSKISINLSEAQDKGYGACSVCKPPSGSSTTPRIKPTIIPNYQNGTSGNESNGTVSSQCRATTKAGTRCKRTTKNSSGY